MSLGLCCQWIEPRTKRTGDVVYENIINEKLLQLGRFRDGKYDAYYQADRHSSLEYISCQCLSSGLFGEGVGLDLFGSGPEDNPGSGDGNYNRQEG